MSSPNIWSALAFVGITFLGERYLSWRRRVKNLPPGPPKLPFIDNLHNMPKSLDWVRFSEQCKKYNTDALHMGALGNSILILDTYEAAKEILEKRAGIYSDRPRSTLFDLANVTNILSITPYGDRWRAGRRMFVQYFGTGVPKIDEDRGLFYTRRCLKQLLDTPDAFLHHLQHSIGSIAISIAYGLEAQPTNDPNVQNSERLLKQLCDIVDKGPFLVDTLPFLRHLPSWFPGTSFHKYARECRECVHLVRDQVFDKAVSAITENSNYIPSLVSHYLAEFGADASPSEIDILKDIASTVYLGAADTTWSSLGTFFLAMVCYPEIQKKAQKELDEVLGGRLPVHEDLKQMSYLMAIFLEVTRWKPVLPMGFVHVATAEDIYKGNVIPKGTMVFPNAWSMLHNPDVYPDPSNFVPERFLKDGKIDKSVRSPLDIAFGFGRRICPGRHIAQSTFLITAASILSTFDLLMQVDDVGEVIQPTEEYHLSLSCHVKDFPCRIVPRTPEKRQVIETWAKTDGRL